MGLVTRSEKIRNRKLKRMFIEFIEGFLREILGLSSFRPVPPLIGEGLEVDLFKLYKVVRKRVGSDLSPKGVLWSRVAVKCGFDSVYGPALKLVYVKYLEILDVWLRKVAKEWKTGDQELGFSFSGFSTEMGSELKAFLSSVVDKMTNDGVFVEVKNHALCNGEEGTGCAGFNVDVMDVDDVNVRNENGGGDVNIFEKAFGVQGGNCDELKNHALGGGEEGTGCAGFNVDVVDVDDGNVRNENGGGDVNIFEKAFGVQGGNCDELKNHALGGGEEGTSCAGFNVDVMNVHDENVRNENGGGDLNIFEKAFDVQGRNCDDQLKDDGGDSVSRKRKRGCYSGVLNWIREVAKDPCDTAIGLLPERQKWNQYGTELRWKKLLLVREAMMLKKNIDASSEQAIWQKKQKMHPTMYEDQLGSERLRCSQRLMIVKDSFHEEHEELGSESSSSGCQSNEQLTCSKSDSPPDSFIKRGQKKIPIGPVYQAVLPKFCEARESYESDSKWLGTRVWPLNKGEHNKCLIEKDSIGKGRQESCSCKFPGSLDCVRFHIMDKRMKLKLELGTTFYMWKFHRIGEEVALYWKKEDEHKFEEIVKSNRLSLKKYFWEELFKHFPKKGREALVNYYYNVFVLRRRGHQNRDSTSRIDSDDEESDYGPISNRFGQLNTISPGSIFCSPKKSQINSR